MSTQPTPRPGQRWRHYHRGTVYTIVTMARDTFNNPVVVYGCLAGDGTDTWVRPLTEWQQDCNGTPRFTLIEEEEAPVSEPVVPETSRAVFRRELLALLDSKVRAAQERLDATEKNLVNLTKRSGTDNLKLCAEFAHMAWTRAQILETLERLRDEIAAWDNA